jgi:hypothetical protein
MMMICPTIAVEHKCVLSDVYIINRACPMCGTSMLKLI